MASLLAVVALRGGQAQQPPGTRYHVITNLCPVLVDTVPEDAARFGGWAEDAQYEAFASAYSVSGDLALLNNPNNPSILHFNSHSSGYYVFDASVPAAMTGFSYQCSGDCPAYTIEYSDDVNQEWSEDTAWVSSQERPVDGRGWASVAGTAAVRGGNSVDGQAGGHTSWPSVGCHRFWRFSIVSDTWHSGLWYWNFQWFGSAELGMVPWELAQQSCLNSRMVLASIHSSYDVAEISQSFSGTGVDDGWIGASDLDLEGTWTWADGAPMDYDEMWGPGEPNGGVGESCGVMSASGTLNDLNCGQSKGVVCEDPPTLPRVDSTYPSFSVSPMDAIRIRDRHNQFVELGGWSSDGYTGLAAGFEMDLASGRFTSHLEGVYIAAAMVRLDFADAGGWYALAIFTNSIESWNSGCSVFSGHNPPPNHIATDPLDPLGFANNHFTVSCVMQLEVGDYASCNVKASSDNDYTVAVDSSGFSMALVAATGGEDFLSTAVAANGYLRKNMHNVNTSGTFVEVSSSSNTFATSGYPSLRAYRSYDAAVGRFTVERGKAGVYFASTSLRIDEADVDYFCVLLLTNGNRGQAWNSGTAVILGSPSGDYEDMSVSGVRMLQEQDYLSVFVYSHGDDDYQVKNSNGGFSVSKLATDVAMSASSHCSGGGRQIRQVGWVELGNCDDGSTGWSTDIYPSLFSNANFDAAYGRFTATEEGMYFAAANVRLDHADIGIFIFAILTNGEQSSSGGASVSDSALAATYESLVVTSIRALSPGDYLSTWIFSDEDDNFAIGADRTGFHVAQLSTELPNPEGSDIDVEAGDLIWQEVWGHPVGHTSDDEGWEHFGSAATWGTCGSSREERIQCCADECIALGPTVCSAFAIHAATRDSPPSVCHYISSEDMTGNCMRDHECIVASDNFGYGWGTWIPDLPHGIDTLLDYTSANNGCTFDQFFDRSDVVNAICCASDDMCEDGLPLDCHLTCAQVYIPFFDDCRDILLDLMQNDIASFQTLDNQCSAGSADEVWNALRDLQNDGCTFGNFESVAIIGSDQQELGGGGGGGEGHRRNQGLNFHHTFDSEDCPHDGFTDRVHDVEAACCMQRGVDVCPEGGVPTECSIECGIVYRSFFSECNALIVALMDEEFPAFEALNDQCNAWNTHQLLEAMQTATCTVPAMSCAEYNALASLEQSGEIGLRSEAGIAFRTHCMLAVDLGTTGHPYTQFWHWTGGEGTSWPEAVTDVLADPYGMCEDPDKCFGRLPEWLDEPGSELVITDGSTTIQFTFDPEQDVAHAAWEAFHDHSCVSVVNGENWTPTLLQGQFNTIQPGNTDSFQYEEAFGVKSFLLDDDGCYCNSALEAGKIMCTSENWGDSANGATLEAGVDLVAPTEGCAYGTPANGPLSMYYRERVPPKFTDCKTILDHNPRAPSGIYTIDLTAELLTEASDCWTRDESSCVGADDDQCRWSRVQNACGVGADFGSISTVNSDAGQYTWTVPNGINTVWVEIWGGGGGGGSGYGQWASGGGGGGYSDVQVAVVPGEMIDIVVGAGGLGSIKNGQPCGDDNGNGDDGGTSSVTVGGQTTTTATGGGHGQSSGGGGGAGGSGGIGNEGNGGAGQDGYNVAGYGGGGGGGGGAGGEAVPNYTEGNDGNAPGGGGSGAASCQNGHSGGGSGADGAVSIFASYVGTNGNAQFEAYCDMETDGGGWTQVLHQQANECLPDSSDTVGEMNGVNDLSYRLGSLEISLVRPDVAWVLSDSTNRVYFRPGCEVDWSGSLRDQNYAECEHGFTDSTFEVPVSDAQDNNGSNGIGMNNGGQFCSIRGFLDVDTTSSLTRGCAAPCSQDFYANSAPEEPVQLWFK